MALGKEHLAPILEDIAKLKMDMNQHLLLLADRKDGPRAIAQKLAIKDMQKAIASFEENELHKFRVSLE